MTKSRSWLIAIFVLFLATSVAFADQEDTDTGIEGTEADDDISTEVLDPTIATATTVAGSAETLTSTATGIDTLGGDDVVTTGSTTTTLATAGGAFVDIVEVDLDAPPPDPDTMTEDHSVTTTTSATGIATGDGNDIVNNGALLTTTANSLSGANAVEISASGSGEKTVKTEATATANSTGIKTGAGDDQVLSSAGIVSIADATSEAISAEVIAVDTQDPDNNVKTNVDADVSAEAQATGIETEDDRTETSSESTTPFDNGGLRITSTETISTVSGDDTVVSTGTVWSESFATSGSVAASVSTNSSGTSATSADVTSSATSSGISTGGGNDNITSTTLVDAHATATAGALGLTLDISNPPPESDPTGPGDSDDEDIGSNTTNVTSTATATGIDAEGSGHSQTSTSLIEIADGALTISRQHTASSVAGDDTVTNFGIVNATATATSSTESADVGISTGGSASTESNATARSLSRGIFTGAGNDSITNNEAVFSSASSDASAIAVSAAIGESSENDNPDSPIRTHEIASSTEGKVEATATAFGIDAEGDATFESSGFDLSIGTSGLAISRNWGKTAEAGNDTVTNSGALTATADASSDTADVSLQINASGSVDSDTSASATANTTAVYTGGGDDSINNLGLIDASATSSASAIAVGVTVSEAPESENNDPDVKPGKSNISTKATVTSSASALGIDAEGTQHNETGSLSLDITRNSLSITHQTNQTSLAGADTVDNQGVILVDASADSGSIAASVSVEAEGSADTNAESKSNATAGGIATGGGSDLITNDGAVTATSLADALALSVGVSVSQPQTEDDPSTSILDKLKDKFASTNNVANVSATASSTGIDAEGSEHNVDQTFNTTISGDGLSITFDRSSLSDSGDDTVDNTGAILSGSIALSGAGAADIDVQTGGTASAEANATSKANSTGIATGGGGDTVTNSGVIGADALSAAGTISVAFSQDGPGAQSKSDAKAESSSTTAGIATDNGEDEFVSRSLTISENGIDVVLSQTKTAQQGIDSVINSGLITTSSISASGAVGVGVTIDGAASADVTSTARSTANGLDTGGGSDVIDNSGLINSTAGSLASAVGVSFGQNQNEKEKPKVKVEANSTAESTATGIAADSGTDEIVESILSISLDGITASHTREVTAASGDDVVASDFAITAQAAATSAGAGVSVAIDGAAKADIESKATSIASGIIGGGGNDDITNIGALSATSASNADAIAAGVGQKKSDTSKASSVVGGKTESVATATGIAGDGGADNSLREFTLAIDENGIDVSWEDSTTAATGDDTIDNSGAILSNAWADTGLVAAAVTIKGSARSSADSKATATAAGIDAGGGTDSVDNSGLIESAAAATANSAVIAVSTQGTAISTNAGILDAGTTAKSSATGISSAGTDHTKSTTITTNVDFDDLSVVGQFQKLTDGVSGDGADTVTNSGAILVNSFSETGQLNVAATTDQNKTGMALTIGRSESEATASGIATGNADDVIDNSGAIASAAEAVGVMGNVSVTMKGLAVAANAAWDGGTTAKAVATGIDADSGEIVSHTVDANADTSLTAQVTYTKTTEAASGNDTITNSGTVGAAAISAVATGSVSVAVKGAAASVSTSQSEAEATAIKGGDGDDDIDNYGLLVSQATAGAATVNVAVTNKGFAGAADAVWDGGTKAEATAIGIAGDGGNRLETTRLAIGTDEMGFEKTSELAAGADNIFNNGDINSAATAGAASLSAAVTMKGLSAATSTSTSEAKSTAIHAGDGDDIDIVTNDGNLLSLATSAAAAASVGFVQTGAAVSVGAVWDGGTGSTARARGIETGNAGDTIVNTGTIDSDAWSAAVEASVSVALTGVAGGITTATAESDAAAIDAGQDGADDTVVNDGELDVESTAVALTAGVGVTQSGVAVVANAFWDGGTNSNSVATGIDAGDGADIIENTGDITVDNGLSDLVDFVLDSDDVIEEININAPGIPEVDVEEILEEGIETVTLRGAGAITAAGSVSVAISGVAGASAQATAIADSIGIDAGDDSAIDRVDNDGDIDVDTSAFAGAASVGVTQAGVAVNWNGGNEAKVSGRGIFTGGGNDDIDNDGDIDVLTLAATGVVDVAVAVTGVAGSVTEQGLSQADATAIDAGSGIFADDVRNTGDLDATAVAVGISASVGVTTAGVAANWNGGTLGDAKARGIDVGDGSDNILNEGDVSASAKAGTAAASVAVAVTGVAGAISKSNAVADAIAIDAGDDDNRDTVVNNKTLRADALAGAASAAVGVTMAGVAGTATPPMDSGTTASAGATAVYLGGGDDYFRNEADDDPDSESKIVSSAIAGTADLGIAFALEGVAGAITAAASDAHAAGVDAGAGNDLIENFNTIDVSSLSNANTASIAITKFGVSAAGNNVWDGGTTATAESFGITTGAGKDTVINEGNMNLHAGAVTLSSSVAFSVAGVSVGTSTATAESTAKAIAAGVGDDFVDNSGKLTVLSHAESVTGNLSITGAGVAGSADIVDGGTSGSASSTGIDGGQGTDVILNTGEMDVDSFVAAVSASAAVTLAGVSAAATTSTSDAFSDGIDAGDGDDTIENGGDLDVDATSNAVAVSASLTGGGVSGAIDSIWDGGTTSNATAAGIRGGAGSDSIWHKGGFSTDTTATANSLAVSFTFSGGGYGFSATQATTNANSDGISAGDGTDVVLNDGDITSTANSNAISVAASITGAGIAASGTPNWDGGTTANANTLGISLGAGDDEAINNANVIADAASIASAQANSAAFFAGVALSDATATADADATAMAGEEGNDTLINTRSLTSKSYATAQASNLTYSTTGGAFAGLSALLSNGTQSFSNATGMSGGDGADGMLNAQDATIELDSEATTGTRSVALTYAGLAGAATKAQANAEAVGADGGLDADVIVNEGLIEGSAEANTSGFALAISGFGGNLSATGTNSRSLATGVAGGGGDDQLHNSGTIDLDSIAISAGVSLAGSQSGFSVGVANAESEADVTGMAGGEGIDEIVNAGDILVGADTTTIAAALGASLGGGTLSTAISSATTNADGIRGGSGDDMIVNTDTGLIDTQVESNVTAAGVTLTGFGASGSATGTIANTTATGIHGGEGLDGILNEGSIVVGRAGTGSDWMSDLNTIGFDMGFANVSVGISQAFARTESFGIDGGDDDDLIFNIGSIDVYSNARSRSQSSSLKIFGLGASAASSGATTLATGISGGAGNDGIASLGTLNVFGNSLLTQGSGADFSLAGASADSVRVEAFTTSRGVDGGSGADLILTAGAITVDAESKLKVDGAQATTIFGESDSSANAGATTRATGIDGGDDDDVIDNGATLDVDARSRVELTSASYTFGGDTEVGGTMRATTIAEGLIGGAGMDQIQNTNLVDVFGSASMVSIGNSSTTIGGASSSANSGAVVTASGIDGGDDDDILENTETGSILVSADADVRTNAVSATFLGGSGNQVTLAGRSTAAGISGGLGDDEIANDGLLTVRADAHLVADGSSSSTVSGGSKSTGKATSLASASGIVGGDGSDLISVGDTSRIKIDANAVAESLNTAASDASITSTDRAEARAETSTTATGLSGGDGDNVIVSEGLIDVSSNSAAYAYSRADGATMSFSGKATAIAAAKATADATGILASDGANTIINDGSLLVSARASTSREVTITFEVLTFDDTVSDPEPIADDIEEITDSSLPDPTERTEGDTVFWTQSVDTANCGNEAYECLDDANVIRDGGYYEVVTVQVPKVDSDGNTVLVDELQWRNIQSIRADREESLPLSGTTATANGNGAVNGNARAQAIGQADATAAGIILGDGHDLVENNGTISVEAFATAASRAVSNGSTLGGNADSFTNSEPDAMARGVVLGGGDNNFTNTGTVSVSAIVDAETETIAKAGGGACFTFLIWEWCFGEGNARPHVSAPRIATAYGVITGDGDNTIRNDGSITVLAETDSGGDDVEVYVSGIETGAGDDIVINNGSISATTMIGSDAGTGYGIRTHAGNDSVTLGAASSVVGRVELGLGDDTLILVGNPLIENHLGELLNPDAGDGFDSLVLMGEGEFLSIATGFENARKLGDGTYSLVSLATLDNLAINGGFLALGSDYTFGATSSFSTFVDSDLTYGGLLVDGVATVDGAIYVARRGGGYIENGTRYSVVDTTGGVVGGFTEVTLPDALPLLSFELEQTADTVDIVAAASSFSTTTDVPLHFQVALNMDSIAPGSTGDLREQLGTIQMMASDFDTAYASMAPDMHLTGTTNTIAVVHQTTQLLRTHLGNARAVHNDSKAESAAYNAVALHYDGLQMLSYDANQSAGNAAIGMPPMAGPQGSNARTWLMGFAGNSDVDLIDGYTDYDQDMAGFAVGADWMPGPNVIAGGSIAFADSQIVMDKAAARTDVEIWSGSLYATAFSDDTYLEGGLYFGRQDYVADRVVTIDNLVRDASSEHDGKTTMAFLGAGRMFRHDGWSVEPYSTLYYFDISEDAFAESGAGDLNQIVAKKSTEALLGELGATFNWLRPAAEGTLDWHLSLAYSHDFEIDDAAIRYAFEGEPAQFFSIDDRNAAGGSAVLGAGLAYIKERSVLSLDYRGQSNRDYRHQVIGARFSYAFR